MTDSQKNCFLAVAEYQSFSRAASALYVSQPAVSKNISALESELGAELFDRQGKYVVLTRAGEIFHNFLLEYRREFNSMMERIRSIDRSTPYGVVRIGCGLTWNAAHFYSRLSRHFAIHFPGIELEVEGLEPEGFLPALRRKEIDMMIMYAFDLEHQPDIASTPIIDIGTGLLCSSMLGTDTDLSSLAEYPFLIAENPIDHRNSNIYRQLITKLYAPMGLTPKFTKCRNLSSALVDLSCGKGSLLVDDWTSSISNSEFLYIPTGQTIPLCLAYLPNSSDALLNLVISETAKVFGANI